MVNLLGHLAFPSAKNHLQQHDRNHRHQSQKRGVKGELKAAEHDQQALGRLPAGTGGDDRFQAGNGAGDTHHGADEAEQRQDPDREAKRQQTQFGIPLPLEAVAVRQIVRVARRPVRPRSTARTLPERPPGKAGQPGSAGLAVRTH